mmetsp:Transcript_25320/g.72552  ORF Transcript_25320/g.72552 Transcript_25320/m.72552 type:complete len:120 (+) Transcript_25320:435-794(+)
MLISDCMRHLWIQVLKFRRHLNMLISGFLRHLWIQVSKFSRHLRMLVSTCLRHLWMQMSKVQVPLQNVGSKVHAPLQDAGIHVPDALDWSPQLQALKEEKLAEARLILARQRQHKNSRF